MEKILFDVDKFNIIQDTENYYFFRALNMGDNNDIENGLIVDENGNFSRIRTDRERWEENPNNVSPRYTQDSVLTLQQVYDHVKMHHRKDTNCISLSSNANVAITYGRGSYKDKYVIIKVPKSEMGKSVVNAGQYMLEEIEKRVNDFVATLDRTNEQEANILEKIQEIDFASNSEEIRDLLEAKYFSREKLDSSKARIRQGITYSQPQARIGNYQSLNREQSLEKDKIIGKLTILERSAGMPAIIPHTANNSLLIGTIGNAFSSCEQTHYGDINGEKIITISKELIDIFALLQQIENQDGNVKPIKTELLRLINDGYRIEEKDGKLIFTNGNDDIILEESVNDLLEKYQVKNDITIDEMYDLTQGRINYGMANSIVKKMFYLSRAQARARQLADILNKITRNNSDFQIIIEYIRQNGFAIEPEIITRKSDEGYRLSEAVNLKLYGLETYLISDIESLSQEELISIMESGGLSNVNEIMTQAFSHVRAKEEISKEKYYATAIVDSYDWLQIGIESFSIEQKNELIQKLQDKNCIEIYRILKENGIAENEIPIMILNLVVKEKSENFLESNNPQEILKNNREELVQDISIEKLEAFLGYYDIDGTRIRLRDYQQIAINKINKIYGDKRFASVILPTGAGKSFVALTEMLEHKEEKILYLAPSNEILDQLQNYIIKYVHGTKGTLGKTKEEIAKEVFPNLTITTYQSLIAKNGKKYTNNKYDFIIFDELHRTGGRKWESKVNELLEKQEKSCKVLGLTATPERDVDGKNMAEETARKLGYTEEEIKLGKYIAINMNLIDAIRLGLVVNPKVISCEYNLIINGNMEELLERINSIEDENERKQRLNQYNSLRKKVELAKGIPDLLKESLKKGGKYIVFIPVTDANTGKDLEDESGNSEIDSKAERKILDAEMQLKQWLEPLGISINIYSMLGEYTDKKNLEQLEGFKHIGEESINLMIAMNKLNEGIHIDGINGIIWMRALDENSKILCQQQLGRIIYSLDEEKEFLDDDRPIVIDLPNNLVSVNLDKKINKYTRRDDLHLLSDIIDWSEFHGGYIPNINSTSHKESRYAMTLKRIQEKYKKYLEYVGNNDFDDREMVLQILELGKKIDLWNFEFPEKIFVKNCIDIEQKVDTSFEITGILKDFYELSERVSRKETTVEKALKICRILKDNGIELNEVPCQKNRKYTKISEIDQDGIDIERIVEENNLDLDYECGKAIYIIRQAYSGVATYAITDDEKRQAEELGIINLEEKETAIAETIRIATILSENGVNLRAIQLMKQGVYIRLSDIVQDGINIKNIAEANNLNLNFEYGLRVNAIRQMYNGNGSYAITEDEIKKAEELGLVETEEKETAIAETIRVARILKQNGVDFRKVKYYRNQKLLKISELDIDGIDIIKIADANGIDLNFKYGIRMRALRKAYLGTGDYIITDDDRKEIEELGLVEEKKVEETAVAETLRVARILKQNGVDLSRIPQKINGKGTRLFEIKQDGIDIEKIAEENGLNLNFSYGTRIKALKDTIRGNGTYLITKDEKEEAIELGLVGQEKKSPLTETLRVVRILKNHGVNLSQIQLNRKENGRYVGIKLSELDIPGIDIKKIAEENGLDLNFDYGGKMHRLKAAYRNFPDSNLTEQEKAEIEELGLHISRKVKARNIVCKERGDAEMSESKLEKARRERDEAKVQNEETRKLEQEVAERLGIEGVEKNEE